MNRSRVSPAAFVNIRNCPRALPVRRASLPPPLSPGPHRRHGYSGPEAVPYTSISPRARALPLVHRSTAAAINVLLTCAATPPEGRELVEEHCCQSGPISPSKRIFGVRQLHLGIMVTCRQLDSTNDKVSRRQVVGFEPIRRRLPIPRSPPYPLRHG
ncbi:hypothetical protein E2C01_054628 [Portunus trituberculatus]|uniref:Uncharacterized protein n=1 Tax=Portunus trituberculatus TaxID=210409 RepID=A0A5B7GSH8_PORTR|nr:hypothetical protein [Portunus trituberculatus]